MTVSDLKEGIAKLREAIEFAEHVDSLPRCPHGNCLRDGAGEILAPSCGCEFKEVK